MLFLKAMPNSIDFRKGTFLHVIPVYIVVPWLEFFLIKLQPLTPATLLKTDSSTGVFL